jgi:hypothetical protein
LSLTRYIFVSEGLLFNANSAIFQLYHGENKNFVDFEKAFDSLDREVLCNLMAHYGIPQKFINIIRNSYNNMQCRVIHEGKLTESFDVKLVVLLALRL